MKPTPTFHGEPDKTTLAEAKTWLRAEVMAGGAECPCCTQFAKKYARALSASMAHVLIMMYKHYPDEWVHVQKAMALHKLPSAVAASGDYAKLRYWGFIEAQEGRREDGSSRMGHWRITEAGKAFVRGETQAASHAIIFADRLLQLPDDELVSIQDVLGTKFDYGSLMASV